MTVWSRVLHPEFEPLHRAIAEAIAEATDLGPALLARLRKRFEREVVHVALDLHAGREKAVMKFADGADLLCDASGVEQATGDRVATHKALRFVGAPAVVDMCCGIGGDAMALARVCSDVTVIDRSPERAFMAGHNAGVPFEVLDAETYEPNGRSWLHIDPARRSERTGARRWRFEDYEPSPEVLERLLARVPAAAVKLGPGIDAREVADTDSRELEFITDRGSLVQAVLWCGELCAAPGSRTATRLVDDAGATLSFTASPSVEVPVADAPSRRLIIPDPALERAQLVAARIEGTGAAELAAGLGILTHDTPLEDPWFEEWEILAELPWREAKIRDWLRAHDGGIITVRTRGGAVATDAAQMSLRGTGSKAYTLFGLRLGHRVVCFVTVSDGVSA